MIPARSYIAEAQARRAKTLRLDDARLTQGQAQCQDEDTAKRSRKGICIAVWEICANDFGCSMHEFVRRWGHKWQTGHGYLDPDEKRYPKPRSVRKALAVLEGYKSGAYQDADAVAKGVKCA